MINSSVDVLKQAIADEGLSWPQFADYCGVNYSKLLGWLTRTYLPDKRTVQSVSRTIHLNETDMLALVDEDKRVILAWATEIAWQAGIDDVLTIRQIPGGRNFVFAVNDKWMLKVACDELGEAGQLLREQAIYDLLMCYQDIPVAELIGSGSTPVPWLIIRKINGLPLERLWTDISYEQKCDMCFQIGQLVAHLHTLPYSKLLGNVHIPIYTSSTWAEFVIEGIWDVLHSLNESVRYGKSQVKELEKYVANHKSTLYSDFQPVLLFNEHYDMHVCFTQYRSGYSIAGMFDFGSVMVGEPSWDFVYANCSFLHRSPDYVTAFREGYETILSFPVFSLERLALYTVWANQGVNVWNEDCESFDAETSMVTVIQEYWYRWLQ